MAAPGEEIKVGERKTSPTCFTHSVSVRICEVPIIQRVGTPREPSRNQVDQTQAEWVKCWIPEN
ncbi:hypothetical protein B0H17DRAFT_574629 [Mycena rosella]|uniref:Uncharacterized protein n=1 Tax=Mycena rosella TaxID=1033263 RepID=A0AAD7DGG1_MYCRO|nr:hypothetical protein B0H17DRAFT_574629 [Mycena rosella]